MGETRSAAHVKGLAWRVAASACAAFLCGCGKPTSWAPTAPTISEEDALKYVARNFDYKRYYTNEFVREAATPPPHPLAPARKLRLGLYWVENDQIAPWFVGLEKGYFSDVGIDLEIVEGGPSRDNLRNLLGGNVDMYCGFASSILQEVTSRTGSDLIMVSANLKGGFTAWIMFDRTVPKGERSSHRITAADLRGKRVGITAGTEVAVQIVIDHFKLAQSDLEVVNVGATPDTLISGSVDYYQGWFDDQPRLLDREGYHNYAVLRFDDIGYHAYSCVSAVTRPFYEKNPDVLRAYVFALNESLSYTISHRQEASEIVARACKAYMLRPSEVLWRLEQDMPLFVGDGSHPLLAFDDQNMLETAAQLYRFHQIELPKAQ